jgi:hypothetical protein
VLGIVPVVDDTLRVLGRGRGAGRDAAR